MKNNDGWAAVGGAIVILWVAAVWTIVIGLLIGWIMNIQNLFTLSDPLTTADVLSIVGLFVAPIGGVMGWYH